MKTRIIAAAALLPLLLVVLLVLPSVFTGILFGLLAAIGTYELLWATGFVKNVRLIIYCAIMALFLGLWSSLQLSQAWLILALVLFAAALYGELLASHAKLPYQQVCICFVAGLVIPLMLTSIARIRSLNNGVFYVLLPFVMAFSSDTGAYFAGRAFGKHKLAPVISPNKTVEGVIGGVAAGVAVMALYTLVLQLFGFQVNYLYAVVYGVVGSLAAVFGDLSFSAVKRQTGIKDYGNLIPGHGGVLDRFDSMTVVAPLAEVLLYLLPLAVK